MDIIKQLARNTGDGLCQEKYNVKTDLDRKMWVLHTG